MKLIELGGFEFLIHTIIHESDGSLLLVTLEGINNMLRAVKVYFEGKGTGYSDLLVRMDELDGITRLESL